MQSIIRGGGGGGIYPEGTSVREKLEHGIWIRDRPLQNTM